MKNIKDNDKNRKNAILLGVVVFMIFPFCVVALLILPSINKLALTKIAGSDKNVKNEKNEKDKNDQINKLAILAPEIFNEKK